MSAKRKRAMVWNDAEFIEAIRLINKFFPESKGFVSPSIGISIWHFIDAMNLGEFQCDYSCEHFGIPAGPDLGLVRKGGFEGEQDMVYDRLLDHAGFMPHGRAVVVPDALGFQGWSMDDLKPFVCDAGKVGGRLQELDCLFDESATRHDKIFVFESGESMAIDHDNRFYWSVSKVIPR